MEIQVLKAEYKEAIKTDYWLQALLAAANKVGYWTIGQWRLKNHPMLTTATNLSIIRQHLKLDDTAVLTEPREVNDEKQIEEHKQEVV